MLRALMRQILSRCRGGPRFVVTSGGIAVPVRDIVHLDLIGFPLRPGNAVVRDGTRHPLPQGSVLVLCGVTWSETRPLTVLRPHGGDDGSVRVAETPIAGWTWLGGSANPVTAHGALIELPDDTALQFDGHVLTVGAGESFSSIAAYTRAMQAKYGPARA
jgi:hypothetical protein